MLHQFVILTLLCFFSILTESAVQLCVISCPNSNELFAKCIETFGSADGGCPVMIAMQWGATNEATSYPNIEMRHHDYLGTPSLCQNINSCPGGDCSVNFAEGASWSSPRACWEAFSKMQNEFTEPQVNSPLPSTRQRLIENRVQMLADILMQHDSIDDLTPDEKMLALRITQEELNELRVEVNVHDSTERVLKSLHRVLHRLQRSVPDEEGCYTNPKCAACNELVQALADEMIDYGIDQICDSIVQITVDTVCKITGPLAMFCEPFLDVTGLTDLGVGVCRAIAREITNGILGQESLDKVCTHLTCRSIDVKNGLCEVSDSKLQNKRCSEFLDQVELMKKGFCIARSTLQVASDISSLTSPSPSDLLALSRGEALDVEAIDNVKTACANDGSSIHVNMSAIFLISFLLFFVFL